MLYIFTIIILILNLIFKNSKLMIYIDYAFLVILLGFSYGPYDTMIFIDRYENFERYEKFTEFLFNQIILFFQFWKFDYRMFMIALAIIELYFLFKFICDNTVNYCYVIAMFLLYPMILMFEQLRYFMAYVIIVVSLFNSIIKKGKKYRIKSIIGIILATLIHSSSLFYLVFLLTDFPVKKVIFFTCIIIVLLSSFSFLTPLLNMATNIIGEEKVAIVGTEIARLDGNYGRSFLIVFIVLGFILLFWYIYNDKKFWDNNDNNKEKNILIMALKCNILCLTCIPLTIFISPAFYRVPQSITLISYIAFSYYMKSESKTVIRTKEFFFGILNIIYSLGMFILLVHDNIAFELILFPFFEENEILKFFM